MKFGEIVDLSLAGYTREQITAIDEMAKQNPKTVGLALNLKNFEDLNALAGMADADDPEPPKPQGDNKPSQQAESVPVKADDAKPAQEDEKDKRIKDLEKELADAQRANVNRDISDQKPKTAEDNFADFMKNL